MIRLRHSLLSLVAFALLACGTAFVAHLHKADALTGSTTADHCELCLQVTPAVSGGAVQPRAPAPLPMGLAAVPQQATAAVYATTRSAHRARAPPRAVTTA